LRLDIATSSAGRATARGRAGGQPVRPAGGLSMRKVRRFGRNGRAAPPGFRRRHHLL